MWNAFCLSYRIKKCFLHYLIIYYITKEEKSGLITESGLMYAIGLDAPVNEHSPDRLNVKSIYSGVLF